MQKIVTAVLLAIVGISIGVCSIIAGGIGRWSADERYLFLALFAYLTVFHASAYGWRSDEDPKIRLSAGIAILSAIAGAVVILGSVLGGPISGTLEEVAVVFAFSVWCGYLAASLFSALKQAKPKNA
jgi:hypothetical protein